MENLIVAVIGILGALLGAGVQYMFSKRGEKIKHYQALRTQSYIDFIKATAGIAISQKRQDSTKEFEATILMADAKARIAIYGSAMVVASIAKFFRNHGALTSSDAISSFVEIVSVMRSESPGGDRNIPNIDIGQLILGEDVK